MYICFIVSNNRKYDNNLSILFQEIIFYNLWNYKRFKILLKTYKNFN